MLGTGTAMACLFLPVRINGDVALLKGIMKEMLEEDDRTGGKMLDRAISSSITPKASRHSPRICAPRAGRDRRASGISRELIRQAAEIAGGIASA